MTDQPVILMIHEARAWLCQGEWSRIVDANEFQVWAAYAGIELRNIDGGRSRMIVFTSELQRRTFETAWRVGESSS